MPNFIEDNTGLFNAKSDLVSLGTGDPNKYVQASDVNVARQALLDIQTVLRGSKWLGITEQAADPAPAGVAKYIWAKTDGVLHYKGSAGDVALGAGGGGTLLDVIMQSYGPVTLGAGLTSNWNPFGTDPKTTVVLVTPNAADSIIDGMAADGSGAAPINGALRMLVHSGINHGSIIVKNSEGSASSAANQFYINSESNISGSGFAIMHRQAALFYYNSDRSKWQLIAGVDGRVRKLGIGFDITDTALANGNVDNYGPTGLAYTSRLRLASLGTTSLTGIVGQSHGDTLWITNFGGTSLTLVHNSAGSSAGNKFLLPSAANVVIPQYGSVILIYDTPNAYWMLQAKGF